MRTDYLMDMKDPDDPDKDIHENMTRLSDFNFDLEIKPYSSCCFTGGDCSPVWAKPTNL